MDKSLLDQVAIPQAWGNWLVDLDDLDPTVPSGVLPTMWQGKTVGEVRKELDQEPLKENLKKANAIKAAQDLLDWQAWTLDKIKLQEDRGEIRRALRAEHPKAHQALQDVFTKLDGVDRRCAVLSAVTLRKLIIPQQIQVFYRGESKKSDHTHSLQPDNKYSVGLNDLTESGRFTVRGEDYYTPYKKITLVPPPSIELLTIDKKEPAYIYYRVQGDQKALKGKSQLFYGYPISVMGDSSTIQVPFGTDLVIRAGMDRPSSRTTSRCAPPLRPTTAAPPCPIRLWSWIPRAKISPSAWAAVVLSLLNSSWNSMTKIMSRAGAACAFNPSTIVHPKFSIPSWKSCSASPVTKVKQARPMPAPARTAISSRPMLCCPSRGPCATITA